MRFAGSNPQIASYMSADFAPRYDEQADAGMKGRSLERQVGHQAEGVVAGAGLDAMAKIQGSKEQARGIVAQGEAQAAGTRAQGMSSMISGIAGGFGSINFGGGGVPASPNSTAAQFGHMANVAY